MPRPLDLPALRAFVAIAEEGSIRKAAERLRTAQPPLSRRLQALEATVGARLLERGTTGVALTEAGRRLLAGARRLLADADALVADTHESGAQRASLRLGVSAAVAPAGAARVAAALRRALGVGCETRPGYTPEIVAALRAGDLDLALVGIPSDVAGLECETVLAQPLVAALPARHPAARRRVVALADLAGTPFFWNRRAFNPAWHDACERVFRESGFRPRYVFVDPDQLATLERIAHGEGCTLVNAWRRTRLSGLAYRRLAEGARLAIRVAAAWRPGEREREARRLVAVARRVLKE